MQRDVAERIGVDTATVTNWERDHAAPEFRWLPAIVDFLGYDPRPQPATLGQALIRHREGRACPNERSPPNWESIRAR